MVDLIGVRLANCPLCEGEEFTPLFIGQDLLHNVPGEFQMVRCDECSFVYLNPRPPWEVLKDYYPDSYAPYEEGNVSIWKYIVQHGGRLRKQRIVERQVPSGSLLDVGCAAGGFMEVMANTGRWQVYGIEPNPEAARRAVKRTGGQVYQNRIEGIELPVAQFDVITMWHVLEHLYEPKTALSNMKRALKKTGSLVVAVPVLDSIDARVFSRYWSGYDVPRHLSVYSKSTLTTMLAEAGFKSIHFENFLGGFDAFRISIYFWLRDTCGERRLLSRFVHSVADNPLLRILMLPYFNLVNTLGMGSTLVAVAKPSSNNR